MVAERRGRNGGDDEVEEIVVKALRRVGVPVLGLDIRVEALPEPPEELREGPVLVEDLEVVRKEMVNRVVDVQVHDALQSVLAVLLDVVPRALLRRGEEQRR